MNENLFRCIDTSEYSLVKDSAVFNENDMKILHIINLEDGDFTTRFGRYTQGNQLIFIDKIWATEHIGVIGNMYPTCMLVEIANTEFCNFQNDEFNNHIKELSKSSLLIIPIRSISSKKWAMLTSSILLCKYRSTNRGYHYVGGQGIYTNNELYVNSTGIYIVAIFLSGIEIKESNIQLLTNKLNLSLPSQDILNTLRLRIGYFKKNYIKENNKYDFTLDRLYNNVNIRLTEESRTSSNLFKGVLTSRKGRSFSGAYLYFSVIKLIWIIQNEINLKNISEDMETEI